MQDHDRNALIGQLFALLTAKFEDGAALAVAGQVPQPTEVANLIEQARHLARDALMLIDAITVVDASRS